MTDPTPSSPAPATPTPPTPPTPEPKPVEPTLPTPPSTPEPKPAEPKPTEGQIVYPEGISEPVKQFFAQHKFSQDQITESFKLMQSLSVTERTNIKTRGDELVKTWGPEKDINLKLAKQALNLYDTEGQLGKVLKATGFGNHPAVLTFFVKLGKELREGGFIKSEPHVPSKPRTLAQAMYGKTHPSKE